MSGREWWSKTAGHYLNYLSDYPLSYDEYCSEEAGIFYREDIVKKLPQGR